jgi:hypothetical protein
VNAAAKEIRKNYSKKISEKLITLIRSSLRVLARYFNSAAVGETQALETKSKGEEGYDAGQCSVDPVPDPHICFSVADPDDFGQDPDPTPEKNSGPDPEHALFIILYQLL